MWPWGRWLATDTNTGVLSVGTWHIRIIAACSSPVSDLCETRCLLLPKVWSRLIFQGCVDDDWWAQGPPTMSVCNMCHVLVTVSSRPQMMSVVHCTICFPQWVGHGGVGWSRMWHCVSGWEGLGLAEARLGAVGDETGWGGARWQWVELVGNGGPGRCGALLVGGRAGQGQHGWDWDDTCFVWKAFDPFHHFAVLAVVDLTVCSLPYSASKF